MTETRRSRERKGGRKRKEEREIRIRNNVERKRCDNYRYGGEEEDNEKRRRGKRKAD